MATLIAQHEQTGKDDLEWIQIPLVELVIEIRRCKNTLLLVIAIGVLLSVAIAFAIPNVYQSTAQLMPPDQQSVSTSSMLGAIAGPGSMPPVGSLMNAKTPGATSIAILESRTAQDDIINKFDLKNIYHDKLYINARSELAAHTSIEEDKRSGVISITVKDHDRYRARDIANTYVDELNKLLNAVNTSAADREAKFLEERLKSIKTGLDSTAHDLSQFSSKNSTVNPQTQGQVMMETTSKLQTELVAGESDLSELKTKYSDDNVRVRGARARVEELQLQMEKLNGSGAATKDDQANDKYPSLRDLPRIGVTYSDLYRQMTMQENLYETLTRQYELARIQALKELPVIKILDAPELPERKSSPHRTLITIAGTFISLMCGIGWIIAVKLWDMEDEAGPLKTKLAKLSNAFEKLKSVDVAQR